MPTIRPPAPESPAPLTEAERQLFERFKQFEAQRQGVIVEHRPAPELPKPPSEKTIRLRELLLLIEKDGGARIESAKAFREIRDLELWKDTLPSFKAACREKLMQLNWVEEMIASIPVWESLQPDCQVLVKSNDELTSLARFRKSDRILILKRAAAGRLSDGGQFATRITDSARALGIQPEAKA
jgi:hypothetical protein